MNKPKISIIVPIYNTEKYLCKCLDSILNQSFKDFELLLVDDGSKDASGKICDDYAAKDKRVKVFHQENQGYAVARNVGLQYAQGEWIYFVDSDDVLKGNALEYMMSLIDAQTSYVMCGFEECDEAGHQKFSVKKKQCTLSVNQALMEMFSPTDYYWQGFLWCKLFKTSIVRDSQLKFDKQIKFNEDRLFNVEYLCHAEGPVAYSTIPVYRYTIHSTGVTASLSSRFNPDFLTDLDAYVKIGDALRHTSKDHGMLAAYAESMCASAKRFYGMCKDFNELTVKRILNVEARLIRGIGFYEYTKDRTQRLYNKMVLLAKKIKSLIPEPIKRWKNRLRKTQRDNKSTLWKVICKTRIYKSHKGVEPCADYVNQMNCMMKSLTIDVSMPYVYPYDVWKCRDIQRERCPLFSMTVDYSIVLQSSMSDIFQRLSSCADIVFRTNEITLVKGIRNISDRIQSQLSPHKPRQSQLHLYFARMLDNEPESFDEALQKMLFYNALFWQANHWHNGLGRLDMILEKYYTADVQSGRLTRSQAKKMLKDFILILGKHTRQKSVVLIGDTGQYILLGGVDRNGRTVQNDLTELFLEVFAELKVPDPKLILRVNEDTSDVVWKKAVDCVITGCGSPLIMNEKLIIDGMVEFGYKKEDVWNVGTSACWEPLIIGKSFDQNNPFPNIPVVTALNEAVHSETEYVDLASVIEATKINIAKQIAATVKDLSFDVSPLYSLFFDSCIERGKDYSQGGADYAYHGVQVVGLPNLVNALLNLKKYVFEQKILSLDDCRAASAANFVGYEDVRDMLLANELKFGNAHPEVVAITNELMSFISQEVEKYTCNGEKLKVGFSSSQYIMARMKSKASLDGRKDYEPFAVHISPVSQKIDIQEVLDFAGSLDYSGNRMNGNVVDFILPPSFIKQKDKLVTILRNAMTQGVYELQLNVLDVATLRDAKVHPEKYPDLVVRVWGFSAYFNDLPEEYKDNLIARAEAYE